jgi:hypothetical protein
MAIGKKNNAADRPSPRYPRPQGVMQRVPKTSDVLVETGVDESGNPVFIELDFTKVFFVSTSAGWLSV